MPDKLEFPWPPLVGKPLAEKLARTDRLKELTGKHRERLERYSGKRAIIRTEAEEVP